MTKSPGRYALFAALLIATAGQLGVVAVTSNGSGVPMAGPDTLASGSWTVTESYAYAHGFELGQPIDRVLGEALDALDVPGVLALAGTTSRARGDLLDNDVRSAISDAVQDEVAIRQSRLAMRIDVPASTVRYHVRVLESAGLVRVDTIWGKRWLSLPTTERADLSLIAALDDETLQSVFAALLAGEPASVSDLARELDRAPSTVSHHLQRLAEANLVERERDGNEVCTSLTDLVRERLREEL